jgi:hypothetical protein
MRLTSNMLALLIFGVSVGEPGVAQPGADGEDTPVMNVGHERDLA